MVTLLRINPETLIYYGSLWDGKSPALRGPGTLYISQGKFGPPLTETCGLPALDLSRFTLLPPLIDCHVHLSLPHGDDSAEKEKLFLDAGVIAVRDGGNSVLQKPVFPLLRVVSTGQAIYRKGYYGSSLGLPVNSVAEAEEMVERLAAAGVSQVKVIASGIFSFSEYGQVGPIPFSTIELQRIVRCAQKYSLPVMAHASGDDAVKSCLNAGVHSIEHGYFMTKDTLRLLAASGTYWVPTLSPVAAQLENWELRSLLGPSHCNTVLRSLRRQEKMVAFAAELGVKIAAGTDAGAPGVPHGLSLLQELLRLAQCGLGSFQALRAGTSMAAAACGLEGSLGEIAEGRQALLLAVEGNPLADLSVLFKTRYLLVPS